jgi:hypothetical protein
MGPAALRPLPGPAGARAPKAGAAPLSMGAAREDLRLRTGSAGSAPPLRQSGGRRS